MDWEPFQQDPSKRLLIWKAPDNAFRILQCFFQAQKHETEYQTGDLFIVFDTPFTQSIQYSRDLKITLAGRYEASRNELSQQGIVPDWIYTPDSVQDSASGFAQSLRSFTDEHQEHIGHLVAVLMPSSITNEEAFIGWVQRLLATGLPERIRLVLIESLQHPRFTPLTSSGHAQIAVKTLNIDALTTAQETFAQEGAVGPAAVFRNFLMGMVTLMEKGSADQVKAKAADTLAFAKQQQWADQEVAVTMLLAAAFLKEKRFEEAVKEYHSARRAALHTVEAQHPAGKTLVMQTWFGEAGVHVAEGKFQPAAECYDQAAAVAQEIPNLILAIEAYRMGIFCLGRLGQRTPALERADAVLKLAEQLEPDTRANTTLPFAGMDILRVVDPDRAKRVEDLKHRMDTRQKQVLDMAEQQIASLSDRAEAQQFQAVDRSLEKGARDAEETARYELNAIVAESSEPFQRYVSEMRRLLGPEWPLTGTLAITPLSQPEGAAVS
jgi:tetratricopeptide (TPR) repeat protein